LTLVPDSEKKATTVDIYASREERKAISDLLDKVLDRMIFDIDDKRIRTPHGANVGAIQAATDESGATDPLMYIKLHNFLTRLRDGIKTEAAAVDLTLEPNTISRDTIDRTVARTYTTRINKLASEVDQLLIKRKDAATTGNVWGTSLGKFEVKGLFDLSQLEGIRSGKDIATLLAKGKVVPEYGKTKIPPADRLYGLKGSKEVLANRAFVVVVEDTNDLSLAENLQVPVKLKDWNKFIKWKRGYRIPGVDPTVLNAYREYSNIFKPKTKLDLLQMIVAFSTGMNEGLIGPRPILRPQILELEDPDAPSGTRRRYYVFTIGGYSGARAPSVRSGMEAALEGVETMPEVNV